MVTMVTPVEVTIVLVIWDECGNQIFSNNEAAILSIAQQMQFSAIKALIMINLPSSDLNRPF